MGPHPAPFRYPWVGQQKSLMRHRSKTTWFINVDDPKVGPHKMATKTESGFPQFMIVEKNQCHIR